MKWPKVPNLGLWVASGGEIDADETHYEFAVRGLLEEIGLRAEERHLRGIVSVLMPAPTQLRMQFCMC